MCVTRFIPSVVESSLVINSEGHTLKADNVRVVPNMQTSPNDCVMHNQTLFADVISDVVLDGIVSRDFLLFQIPAMIGSVVDPFPCVDPMLVGTFICNGNRIFLPLTQRLPYNRIIVIKNEATLRSEHMNLHRVSTSTLKVAAKVPRGGSVATLQVSIPWYKKTLDVSVIVNALGFTMSELKREIACFMPSIIPEFVHAPEISEHVALSSLGACFITRSGATADDLIAKGRLQVLNEILPHLTSFGPAEKLRMLGAMCGTALGINTSSADAEDDADDDDDDDVDAIPDAVEMPVPWYDDTGETLAAHVRVKLKDVVNKCSSTIYKRVMRATDRASVSFVLTQLISASKLTRTIVMSFTTGTWVKRKGISEQLATENTPASSAITFMVRKVVNPVCKRGPQIAHRSVNKTSIGRVCPVSTPDGEGVGLRSTLSASALVSQLGPSAEVQTMVDSVLEPTMSGAFRYFDMFGRWRGWVSDAHEKIAILQMHRRAGRLPSELGFEITNRAVFVTMSRGRLLRQLLHRTSGIVETIDAAEEITLCTVAFSADKMSPKPGDILYQLS
jgi:DNA-directed RNA polymerase beta subunit